jgi:CHAT domain-containing protein
LHIATHGFFADAAAGSVDGENATVLAAGREAEAGLLGARRDEVRGISPGLLSGLVLAGANTPPDLSAVAEGDEPPEDGILTADEITFLPLTGVRLAVLSACETGLGESAGGEGLLGIQRALQVAGVRATIATLWKVNDLATRTIMEEFYRNYVEKEMSPLDALRAAQIWALHNRDLVVPRGADLPETESTALPPEFWAAFILSGDWR